LAANRSAAAVAEGYQRYAQALETVENALYKTAFYNVPVVSAGLANPGAAGTKIPNGLSAVSINDTLSYLRMYGLDSFVNAWYSRLSYREHASAAARGHPE
jgi:hypothetical protein